MAWRYGWFAERYGWTPNQVDEQPVWVMMRLPGYASAVDAAKVTLRLRAQEEAERQAAAGGR